ncbi:50S ribosomal protein L6 [Candidatus Woesearchaeota archaeon]|nr:50S ribosomal protein L6 [Candidatus Woesearchaeota archaeon]
MKGKVDVAIELPSGVTASYASGVLTVKGPKGEVSRKLFDPVLKVDAKDGKVLIKSSDDSRKQKRVAHSFRAHVKNIVAGVQVPYRYVLKVCSGHFPINVSIQGELLLVKNFLGEKFPRVLKLKKGASVKVEGDKITIETCDKELGGRLASDIELLTAKRNRDLRVFQDGIYMIEKANKVVGTA